MATIFEPPFASIEAKVSFTNQIAPNWYTPEQEVSPDDAQRLCDSRGYGVRWMTVEELEALQGTVPSVVGKFESLVAALEGWFDKAWSDLPADKRARIVRSSIPRPWNEVKPDQRRGWAQWWDHEHNPAKEGERQAAWDRVFRGREIERQIRELELQRPLNVSETIAKEDRLKLLNAQLGALSRVAAVPADRAARVQARVAELKATGVRAFLKQVATEEKISVSRIKQLRKKKVGKHKETSKPKG